MKIIISPILQMRKLKHRLKNFQRTQLVDDETRTTDQGKNLSLDV